MGLVTSSLVVTACTRPDDEMAAERAVETVPDVAPTLDPSVIAPSGDVGGGTWTIDPSYDSDESFAQGPLVAARRMVYRVTLHPPPSFQGRMGPIPPPTGELLVDVSADRLRARFQGPIWPVESGSEVRMRADASGVYLFDGQGGRPIGPRQFSTWFEGDGRTGPASIALRVDEPEDPPSPGLLVCRFLAEWTGQPVDVVIRRCGEGGAPIQFRAGIFGGLRTADVPVQLDPNELRADHRRPPERPKPTDRLLVSSALLSRIEPVHARPSDDPVPVFQAINEGAARALVMVQGIPLGWLLPGARMEALGLKSGCYRMGALRPFGVPIEKPGRVCVPGSMVLGRGRAL